MKNKYDLSKVPRELLEKLVTARGYLGITWAFVDSPEWQGNGERAQVVREIRKAASVPIRTRVEVDTDIAKAIRDYIAQQAKCDERAVYFDGRLGDGPYLPDLLHQLASEETSD